MVPKFSFFPLKYSPAHVTDKPKTKTASLVNIYIKIIASKHFLKKKVYIMHFFSFPNLCVELLVLNLVKNNRPDPLIRQAIGVPQIENH